MQAVVTAQEMSETLEHLAAELHQLLSRMHASRPSFDDPVRREQFLSCVQELADKTQQAREMANAMWASLGNRMATARDSVQARKDAWGEKFAQAKDAAQASKDALGERMTEARDSAVAHGQALGERMAEARDSAVAHRQALGERMAEARDSAAARRQALGEALDSVAMQLRTLAADCADGPRMASWKAGRDRLSTSYEDLLRTVRNSRLARVATKQIHLPHLKPTNYHRNIFHVGMGVGAVGMYELFLTYTSTVWILLAISVLAGSLEITRKIWPQWNLMLMNSIFFRRIARPREHDRINSASVYTFTLLGVCLLAPMIAVEVGLLVLAFADPTASIVGKRWGVKKVWRQKSWAGSLAFLLVAFSVAFAFLTLKSALPTMGTIAGASFATALVATVTETLSDRLDDNFSVLAMSTAVAALFFM
jgi:dolichol kinase